MPVFGLKSTFLKSSILAYQRRELIIEEVHKKSRLFHHTIYESHDFFVHVLYRVMVNVKSMVFISHSNIKLIHLRSFRFLYPASVVNDHVSGCAYGVHIAPLLILLDRVNSRILFQIRYCFIQTMIFFLLRTILC